MVSGQKKSYCVVNCAVSPTLSALSGCAFVSICQAFVQEKKGDCFSLSKLEQCLFFQYM